jgi:hypothetical protein
VALAIRHAELIERVERPNARVRDANKSPAV